MNQKLGTFYIFGVSEIWILWLKYMENIKTFHLNKNSVSFKDKLFSVEHTESKYVVRGTFNLAISYIFYLFIVQMIKKKDFFVCKNWQIEVFLNVTAAHRLADTALGKKIKILF